MKRGRRRSLPRGLAPAPPAAAAGVLGDDEVMERFQIRLHGFLAEADLRGMSPVAVFFDWLDDLRRDDPDRADLVLASLPLPTRRAYRAWRDGEGAD